MVDFSHLRLDAASVMQKPRNSAVELHMSMRCGVLCLLCVYIFIKFNGRVASFRLKFQMESARLNICKSHIFGKFPQLNTSSRMTNVQTPSATIAQQENFTIVGDRLATAVQ